MRAKLVTNQGYIDTRLDEAAGNKTKPVFVTSLPVAAMNKNQQRSFAIAASKQVYPVSRALIISPIEPLVGTSSESFTAAYPFL